MPKESNERRLALLLRVLTDTASNVVAFKERAFSGSPEADDLGLAAVLPADVPREEAKDRLKAALAGFLRRGGQPNRIEYTYEDSDPETIYKFRFELEGTRLYVKTELKLDDPSGPILIVKSVKRRN